MLGLVLAMATAAATPNLTLPSANPPAAAPASCAAATTPPADDPLVCRNERKAAAAEAERGMNARPVAQGLEVPNIRIPGH